jgi:hypothetical protein
MVVGMCVSLMISKAQYGTCDISQIIFQITRKFDGVQFMMQSYGPTLEDLRGEFVLNMDLFPRMLQKEFFSNAKYGQLIRMSDPWDCYKVFNRIDVNMGRKKTGGY